VKGTDFDPSGGVSCNAHQIESVQCPDGDLTFAYYHSHPGRSSFDGEPGDPGSDDYGVANFIRKRNFDHFGIDRGGGFVAYNQGINDFTEETRSGIAVVEFTNGLNPSSEVDRNSLNFNFEII